MECTYMLPGAVYVVVLGLNMGEDLKNMINHPYHHSPVRIPPRFLASAPLPPIAIIAAAVFTTLRRIL